MNNTNKVEMKKILRIPHTGIRPENYVITEEFLNLRQEIDKYLESLNDGALDSGNGNILDGIIDAYTAIAVENVKDELAEHVDLINELTRQRLGDFTKKQHELVEYTDMLADVEKQLAELKDGFGLGGEKLW